MTDNERDTKFLGFAKLLWQEIGTTISEDGRFLYYFDGIQVEAATLAIAQRAYDLTCHDIDYLSLHGWYTPTQKQELLDAVPDLTEWPPPK